MSLWWIGIGLGLVLVFAGLVFVFINRGTLGEIGLEFAGISLTKAPIVIVVIALGLGATGYSIVQYNASNLNGAHILVGEVSEIKFAPPAIDSDAPASTGDAEQAFKSWLDRFRQEAQIELNIGQAEGLARGDSLATTLDPPSELRNLPKADIAVLHNNQTAQLSVVDVGPHSAVARLDRFAYRRYLDQASEQGYSLRQMTSDEAPVAEGTKVVAIPRDESSAKDDVYRDMAAGNSPGITPDQASGYYRSVLAKSERFFHRYGGGYFAPDVLYTEGLAQYKLRMYEESIGSFQDLVDVYPFHPSAPGASGWIARAQHDKMTAQVPSK